MLRFFVFFLLRFLVYSGAFYNVIDSFENIAVLMGLFCYCHLELISSNVLTAKTY